MTFSSPKFFLVFLPLCLFGYWVVGRFGRRPAVVYLAMASMAFYAAWSNKYLLVLLGSIGFNFLISLGIARCANKPSQQRAWLVVGIVGDLAALCFYKYLFPLLGFAHSIGLTHQSWGAVILPLGISFFTFTQIAYLIDLQQGTAGRESLGSYALFVTFFPHLIAGPILHHKEIMPQFREEKPYLLRADDMAVGLSWFTLGFVKKTLIADRISPTANVLFAHPGSTGTADTWLGALTYAMQLYFDFSGYSDMAIGLARMFSIRFPMNFNSPYKATSIVDFWQRWHMTLTRYIMDYVYAPVQMKVSSWRMDHGKKVSRKAQATVDGFLQMILFPTMFTMFLAGVWHGAGLQFILYGVMHGLLISCNHTWRIFVPKTSQFHRAMTAPVATALTFLCVVVTFIMFRADSVRDAFRVYGGLLGRHGSGDHVRPSAVAVLAALMLIVWLMPNTQEIFGEALSEDGENWSIARNLRWAPTLPWWALTACAFLLCMAYCSAGTTFLYFQF